MSTIKDFCPPVTVHFQEPEKTSRWYYASYGHIKNSHISKVTTKASGNSERMATLMTQISQNKHQLPVSTDSSNSQFSLIYQGFPTFCTPPSQIVWQWEGGVHFIISWVISQCVCPYRILESCKDTFRLCTSIANKNSLTGVVQHIISRWQNIKPSGITMMIGLYMLAFPFPG